MKMSDINLSEVLLESFELLGQKPKLFIPKLFSSVISAVWFLGLIEGQGSTVYYLISLPLLVFMGFFVSIMVAGMVKNSGSNELLKEGFKEATSSMKPIIYSTGLLMLVSFIISLPLSFGLAYYLIAQSIIPLVVGSLITLGASLALSFALYFYPISLLEEKSVFNGLKSSKSTAFSNSKEVLLLTAISFALVLAAAGSQNYLKTLGYIGFIAGRLLSAIVTTYLFVVSPKYYLD